MAETRDATTFVHRQATIDVVLPDPAGNPLRGQVGFMERLSEQLYALAAGLRLRGWHVAAQETEFAAMGLITGADQQRPHIAAADDTREDNHG